MSAWVPEPPRAPHRCYATRQGVPAHGPYFDVGLDYFLPTRKPDGRLGVNPALQRLYLSARAIQNFCEAEGSPLVALPNESYDREAGRADGLAAQLQAANDRVAELEVEASDLREKLALFGDPEALATLIAEKVKPVPRRKVYPKDKATA